MRLACGSDILVGREGYKGRFRGGMVFELKLS